MEYCTSSNKSSPFQLVPEALIWPLLSPRGGIPADQRQGRFIRYRLMIHLSVAFLKGQIVRRQVYDRYVDYAVMPRIRSSSYNASASCPLAAAGVIRGKQFAVVIQEHPQDR